jgi:hypothetical protein
MGVSVISFFSVHSDLVFNKGKVSAIIMKKFWPNMTPINSAICMETGRYQIVGFIVLWFY